MKSWARLTLGVGLVLALSGCESAVGYCDICTLTSEVRGQVLTKAGLPVVGATVSLRALYSVGDGPCGGYEGFDEASVVDSTDVDGRFDMSVGGVSIAGPVCVEVSVEPPTEASLLPTVDSVPADFSLPGERPEPVSVSLVLNPSGR